MSLSFSSLLSFFSFSLLLIVLPTGAWAKFKFDNPNLVYHNGPILTGQLNLAVLWYGRFGASQKKVLRDFISSINNVDPLTDDPNVNAWWKMVEQYQAAVPGGDQAKPPINVKLVRQKTDRNYSVGKILTQDFLPTLVPKATGGIASSIAVIFAARDVSVQGSCMGKCFLHGSVGTDPNPSLYIVVGNPESECPGACAWPFYKSNTMPSILPLQPPNGNVGVDAMVIGFAGALAETVTNPYNTGFYDGNQFDAVGAATACPGVFGSGAFPGFAGKVHIAPDTGGCFNAKGVKNRRFLLPAVWNPFSRSCQTLM